MICSQMFLKFLCFMCVWSVTQLCLTLCIPMDCSPPGSSIHGIFQGRMLEQVARYHVRESFRLRIEPTSFTYPALADEFFTIVPPGKPTLFIGDLYTDLVAKLGPTLYDPIVAHQGPLSMWFSREEYWSGLSLPSIGNFPHPQIELGPPELQVDSLPTELPEKSIDVRTIYIHSYVSML